MALSAPELTGEQLVGVSELAEIAGVAASTLRAYISRDEGDVPAPQATVNGRSVWARPVAQEWAEARRRSPEGIRAAVATHHDAASLPEGVAQQHLENRVSLGGNSRPRQGEGGGGYHQDVALLDRRPNQCPGIDGAAGSPAGTSQVPRSL